MGILDSPALHDDVNLPNDVPIKIVNIQWNKTLNDQSGAGTLGSNPTVYDYNGGSYQKVCHFLSVLHFRSFDLDTPMAQWIIKRDEKKTIPRIRNFFNIHTADRSAAFVGLVGDATSGAQFKLTSEPIGWVIERISGINGQAYVTTSSGLIDAVILTYFYTTGRS